MYMSFSNEFVKKFHPKNFYIKFVVYHLFKSLKEHACTVEPLLRGHPDERPTPLERPLDTRKSKHKCIDFYP